MTEHTESCHACGAPARYSILLVTGERLYIPNQHAREAPEGAVDIRPVWFCRACMRAIENALRATIESLGAVRHD